MIDYHIHTKLCKHAIGEMEDYVRTAVEKGLNTIGFSDHLPFDESFMKNLSMERDELEGYIAAIPSLEKKFGIRIYTGIEADYYPGRQEEISALVDSYSFDYVFGSVHYINGWGFDNPKFITEWEKHDINMVYQAYYKNVMEMAETGLYDIVAHMDLVKKFSYLPTRPFDEEINEVMAAIKKSGMILEINTSGLRKPVQEIYPSMGIVKVAKKYDVPVVLGSDAHTPKDVGADFDKGASLLKGIGYTKTAIIEKREIVGWEKI